MSDWWSSLGLTQPGVSEAFGVPPANQPVYTPGEVMTAAGAGPSWLDRARAQAASDIAAYQAGGVPQLMQTTANPMGLAGGFGGVIRAYHGSPYSFSKFDIGKVGTGEGAQSYGHGLYFAENPEVAQSYRQALGGATVGGRPYDVNDPIHLATGLVKDLGSREAAIANLQQRAVRDPGDFFDRAINYLKSDRPLPEYKQSGHMYEVNINANPEQFLQWDRPLSGQTQAIRDAYTAARMGKAMQDPLVKELFSGGQIPNEYLGLLGRSSGAQAYNTLADELRRPPSYVGERQALASQALQQAGIPGIRYLDQFSRLKNDPNFPPPGFAPETHPQTSNYVVFDPNIVDIIRKYGVAGLGITPAAVLMGAGQQPTQQVQ